MAMNDNETSKHGKAGRIIGTILLLIVIFAAAFFLLNLIRISYPVTESASAAAEEETVLEGTADDEEDAVNAEDTDEDAENVQEAAEDNTETADDTETEETAEAAETGSWETAPEADDGSGAAGLKIMDESIMYLASEDGWYRDEYNLWYSPDNVHYYYNGWVTLGDRIYHFDAAGMVDRGWKTIGGTEYYFDESGVYDPDAVH